MKQKSNFLRLNWRDALKGFTVAILTVILCGLISMMQEGTLPTWEQFKPLLISGLVAGLAYLTKNIFSNSTGEMFSKETL